MHPSYGVGAYCWLLRRGGSNFLSGFCACYLLRGRTLEPLGTQGPTTLAP